MDSSPSSPSPTKGQHREEDPSIPPALKGVTAPAHPKEDPVEDRRMLRGSTGNQVLRPPRELSRRTTYTWRLPKGLFLTFFSFCLLPLCFASATLSASLRCGADFEESVEILGHSIIVARTHLVERYDSAQVGLQMLINPSAAQEKRSLMVRVLESNAKAKQAAAAAQLSIARAISGEEGEPIPVESVVRWGVVGFFMPFFFYFLLSFLLTRLWLRRRHWETVEHLERRHQALLERSR